MNQRIRNFWLFAFCILSFALPAAAAPTLRILEPAPDWYFEFGKPAIVRFETSGYVFVNYENNEELYPTNKEAGHAHVWLDPENGNLQHSRAWHFYSARPIVLDDLAFGEHKVVIELAANEHSPLKPQVLHRVPFFVGEPPEENPDSLGDVQPWSSFGDAMFFVFILVMLFAVRSARAPLMRWFAARKKLHADQQKKKMDNTDGFA